MSDNVVLRILETLQDEIKKIRTEDKNELLARTDSVRTELIARIDNVKNELGARIDHLSTRFSTSDLAHRVEKAKRHGELENRIARLEAEIEALKAAAAPR